MTDRALHWLRALCTAGVLLLALALPLASQDVPDLAAWGRVAENAEQALGSSDTTDRMLDDLRRRIVAFREQFLSAQGSNQTRIDTLQSQIAALGAEPGDGDPPETDAVAARRADLAAQLARLEGPRRVADEAFNRADGLIREIDQTVREREAAEVLRQGPSPLNPALWPAAVSELARSFVQLPGELVQGVRTKAWNENPLLELFLLLVALALVLRGRFWMEWLTLRLYTGQGGTAQPAIAFLVSLGQVALPVIGLVALREAAYLSEILGPRGRIVAQLLPVLGLIAFGAIWIGARVFPRRDVIAAPIPVPRQRRVEGRVHAAVLGITLSLYVIVSWVADLDGYSDGTLAVITFPLLIVAGTSLVRLGLILSRVHAAVIDGEEDGPQDTGYFGRMARIIGRVCMVFGVAGPVLAALGYQTAASNLIFPTILSLALMALLAVLRVAVRDFYALITGVDETQAGAALIPVLVMLLLAIASLPVFALIWGARVVELFELWARFREGFTIGDTRVSPGDFISLALVFLIGYGLTRILQGTLKIAVLPKTQLDTGLRNAITSGIGYVGIFLAAVLAITSAGLDLSSLALVAGALSVGIGFGLQTIVSNFISGIILLIERPISEGDWIEVGGQMGYVRDISVRSTRIETFDRTDVIVPNADFVSGTVTNWTRGNLVGRVIVPVGVAYGTDTRQVERILLEIAEAHPLVVLKPPPAVLFIGFGESSLDFEIRAILRDVNFVLSVKSDMNHEIAARFVDADIEIPFPQRDIWLRNAAAPGGGETGTDTREAPIAGHRHDPRTIGRGDETDVADGNAAGDGDR